jgi:hypothetical protein
MATLAILLLGGCFNNPTIDEELAQTCSVSVRQIQDAQASLERQSIGSVMNVGGCRLSLTSEKVISGSVIEPLSEKR